MVGLRWLTEVGPDTGGLQILSTADYYKNLFDTVTAKDDAGFDVSLTDYWGRALSFQLVNATDGGPGWFSRRCRLRCD